MQGWVLFNTSVLCQGALIFQGCLPWFDFLVMLDAVTLRPRKGGGCRVRISSQERSKGFLSRCRAHDYCPGGKKVNSKVTVNALEDILAGLAEAGKEIESLYRFNKDGFCFLVHLALLPQESTTVFVLWTCLSLHLPDVAPKLPFLRPDLALGKTAKKLLLMC